ncbi:MAG: methylated-DNA--[protein]-cysteine S-methyltransferase, partial [Deltaproteobacteria bacterium]|nr:methylated-DNA--[protein]-cysteine S-methyltransferase [Deltaproteobacteria bacterium]
FIQSHEVQAGWSMLRKNWPKAHLLRDDPTAVRLAHRVFTWPAASQQPLRAFVRGTPFQVRVWRALLQVRPGTLVSYGRLAAAINKPTASRAVGTAVGQNPLAYLIPCHRVIRKTGVIGNYRWGRIRKRAILAWESSSRFAGENANMTLPNP